MTCARTPVIAVVIAGAALAVALAVNRGRMPLSPRNTRGESPGKSSTSSRRVLPQGHCFENTAHLILGLSDDTPEGEGFRAMFRGYGIDPTQAMLVHGVPTHRSDHVRYAHAWVEVGDVVLDLTTSPWSPTYLGPKERYYQLGKIQPGECTSYSPREVKELAEKFRHWGPWALPLGEFALN